MSSTARMHLIALFTIILGGLACNEMPAPFEVEDRSPRADRQAPFNPEEQFPGWAYDEPEYVKPARELPPEPRVKKGDPLHYFTNKTIVPIRQPGDYTPEEIPRVAVWWTDNNGFHWHKAGYFGREQSFFPFEIEEDGDYGIRFVGPGQIAAMHSLPYPERVYHVDTVVPEVEVTIDPEQTWYHPGQTIAITWHAEDFHLIENPVRIGMLMDFTADEREAIELQRELTDEGTITYIIPENAIDHELRFRVDAEDRAGNLGIAFSYALQVIDESLVDADGALTEQTTDVQDADMEVEEIAEEPALTMIFPRDLDQGDQDSRSEQAEQVAPIETNPAAEVTAPAIPVREDTKESENNQLVWNTPTPNTYVAGSATEPKRSSSSLFDASRSAPADASGVVEPMKPIDAPATLAQREPARETTLADESGRHEASNTHYADDLGTTPTPQVMGLTGPITTEPQTEPNASKPTAFPSALKVVDSRNIEPAPAITMPQQPLPMREVTPTTPSSETPSETQSRILESSDEPMTPVSDAGSDSEEKIADITTSESTQADEINTSVPQWEPAPVAITVVEPVEPKQEPAVMVSAERTQPEIATVIDPTYGNGLLIPMPATVESRDPTATSRLATAHPWRMLGTDYNKPLATVWVLPRPDFGYQLEGMFPGEFLANSQIILPVAKPGQVDQAFAGVSEDLETVPTLTP